ncbi:YncE family protein [Lysinibacillus sp. KU-BSD001]|uniref:YncE family protein n=1 Tax=Lysinibacillus sp. KU-BSD001 TaxID=3141328 RepID=UPI0036EDB6A7
MNKSMIALLMCLLLLTGCSEQRFTPINPHQPFVASVNILQPSLTFFDQKGDPITTWEFESAYTGGVLIQHDRVLMYGHELTEAHLYEISTGKQVATIECGMGTTNAYYDNQSEQFFMTNSKTNAVISYDSQGKKLHEQKLYNYPMSMVASNGYLYVVNYKDTVLSVLDIEAFTVVDEWEIAKSSHGIAVLEQQNKLWIGGHGEGSKPNETIDVYDLTTGEKQTPISMPLMPVGIAKKGDEVAVISHGESMLYVADIDGEILWQQKVGANPFAVQHFMDFIVVAGYDDQTIYFLEDEQVIQKVQTNKGPFQLLVREGTT